MTTSALIAVALGLCLSAVREWRGNLGAQRMLRMTTVETPDVETGLLPAAAIPLCLLPELEWAAFRNAQVGVVIFRVHALARTAMISRLRAATRDHEYAFQLSRSTTLVGLCGVTAVEALWATARLGSEMLSAGRGIIDAGVAIVPDDGADINSLIDLTSVRLRPIHEHMELASELRTQATTTTTSEFAPHDHTGASTV